MQFLAQYDWPGNIRELQNFVERAVIMSSGPNLEIPFGELKAAVGCDMVNTPMPVRTLAEAQRDHILETLRRSGGVVGGRNGAAARLGLARTTLLYRMRKLGIAMERADRVAKDARWAGLGNSDCVTCLSSRQRNPKPQLRFRPVFYKSLI